MWTWRGERNFGPFEKLFEGHYAPYKFLLIIDQSSKEAVIAVQNTIKESSNLEIELQTLLDDIDWRSHLVAGTAALLLANNLNLSVNLWMAFDRGSWVTPQLAGFLYFHDPQFSQRAKERLEKRCPVKWEFIEPLSKTEHQQLQGPLEHIRLSKKGMSSLMGICSTIPSLKEYISKLATQEDVKQLLENERTDWGEGLVEGWLPEMQRCFSELGIELVRAEEQHQEVG